MDIEALRSFIAFVDTGSFTRAAKQIHRTQSAISMQMKKLEEATGKELFIKEGRNLGLTEHGRKLTSYARRLLAIHDQALSDLKHRSDHPPLILGCPDDYADSVLPTLIALLLETHPQQEISILCASSTRLRALLDRGEIHAAILTRAPEKDEGYLLVHDKGVWTHGGYPELIERDVLPLVLYDADCKFHSTAVDALEKQNRAYQLIATSSSATALKGLLLKGIAISALARSTVSKDLTVLESTDLPDLPAIDIVLALAPHPHPVLTAVGAMRISEAFGKRENH
ncbi:LysR family transcriptional regulator [Pontibacterium sp.]|uniref:LysR family transcriptional regulator n=1 Tax=Pontibacterium sp. TaxID=2036026 RepID=UPI003564F638